MKTCSKCREEKDESLFPKSKGSKGGIRNICKKCHSEQIKEIKKKIPIDLLRSRELLANIKYSKSEKYKSWWREYRITHKETLKVNRNKCISKNPEKYKSIVENNKTLVKAHQRKYVDELHDGYLRQILKNEFDIVKDYPELIEVKRIMIKTKRLCRTLNN